MADLKFGKALFNPPWAILTRASLGLALQLNLSPFRYRNGGIMHYLDQNLTTSNIWCGHPRSLISSDPVLTVPKSVFFLDFLRSWHRICGSFSHKRFHSASGPSWMSIRATDPSALMGFFSQCEWRVSFRNAIHHNYSIMIPKRHPFY